MTRTCPLCGTTLNRLEGRDGWAVEPTVDTTTRRRVIERRVLAVVYTCPHCEHCEDSHASH